MPIFQARAIDKDSSITCKEKQCKCAESIYSLQNPDDYNGLFNLVENGTLLISDIDLIEDEKRYEIVIIAGSAENKKAKDRLHLSVEFESDLHRVKRSIKTNSEPINKQIANFQTTFNLKVLAGEPGTLVVGNTVQYKLEVIYQIKFS